MHGMMFHHFHSTRILSRPGSFSAAEFSRAIDFLEKDFRIVSPHEFFAAVDRKVRPANQLLLTFDDALMSQFDVAAPVLAERGLTGAFAIYSSLYLGNPDPLEIFASFRNECFSNFSEFWEAFLSQDGSLERRALTVARLAVRDGFLREFPFYSDEEKLFRFIRDQFLSPEEYNAITWAMIENYPDFDSERIAADLWMGTEELRSLLDAGHFVGLHSHTHPTRMDLLDRKAQQYEYETNYEWIRKHLGVKPRFVAHPCGRYNSSTLDVLSALGVSYGFRSTLGQGSTFSQLEIPRQDSASLLAQI